MTHKVSSLIMIVLFAFSCSQTNPGEKVPDGQNTSDSISQNTTARVKKNIVFFGNSLTAAYGLNPSDGFVALLQNRIDSLGLPYKAVNAGLSGETTAGGRERVSWVIRQPLDIFVLELGGNDALRGIPPSASRENLDSIIQTVKNKYPDAKIILAGMEAPPNMGPRYTTEFRQNYKDLAKKHGIELIPFFLEDIGGIAELNQRDGIHPNEAGQKILLENVWRVLEKLL